MDKTNKSIYVVLEHKYVPSKKERGKWEVIENCEIVDQLKTRHQSKATIILDIKKSKIVKNRGGDREQSTYQHIYNGLFERYPDQMNELAKLIV